MQSRFNRIQAELYLWVMLMEKDDLKISNEPQLYVWYCFKLTHFGHIREGTFTLGLYHDPFPFPEAPDMNRMRGKASEEVIIELAECTLTDERAKPKENVKEQRGGEQRRGSGREPQVGSAKDRKGTPIAHSKSTLKTMTIQPSQGKVGTVKDINE